jgi:hypothetical protein
MKYHYKFIDDLIPLILDADEHWWQCHLAALAAVSHAWLYYVRQRLYACPDIRTFSAVQKLANTLETNEYLASLVRGISLQPSGRSGSLQGVVGAIKAMKAIRMLLGLEGLKRISVGGDMGERYIRLIGNPEMVEDLHISGQTALVRERALTWDEMLTLRFPRLKKIRLSEIDLEVMWPTVEYPASFTQLILEDVDIRGGRLVQMLNGAKWLGCLHISSCGRVEEEEELREVLGSCVVECLRYQVRTTFGRWNPFSELGAECGRTVRCLHLDGHLVDVGILDTLRVVFCNLEVLDVRGHLVSVLASEWTEFVSGGALRSLRRLGLPWGTNRPPFVKWNSREMGEIRGACAKRRIGMILERGKVI